MSRYIDAELLKSRIKYYNPATGGCRKPTKNEMKIDAMVTFETLLEWVDRCPQADVAPVVHAEWEDNGADYKCSNCGHTEPCYDMLYCPHCGAKMDRLDEPKKELK